MSENRLINETSPYLLQHAHQPVDWYPWCEEAFEKAKVRDCPVFVSIGYSTCHWCHVMAHESFDDEEIAKLLNDNYVSIKVDREERPDVDSVYMEVCVAISGSGGWPMSVFLTPDKKPIYVGTYFPKDSFRGMLGFRQILTAISNKWKDDRSALLESADGIVRALSSTKETKSGEIKDNLIEAAVKQFSKGFDEEYGGFGNAPKFPTPHNLLFLLDEYRKKGDKQSLNMAQTTLKAMYRGGLFDHIGFGFSRYSTDREYMIPHFEKMLYDNALLIMAYVSAFDVTSNMFYLDVAKKTADYLTREMISTEGGFYSAQDADSEGKEGAFYALSPNEIIDVFGKDEGEKFNKIFGITASGNFEGKNIPHIVTNFEEADSIKEVLPELRKYRKERFELHLDDKILTSWNGLMIAAFADLARTTGTKAYLDAAERAEKFIEENLMENDSLYVSFRNGRHSGIGFLDDYAFTIFALLKLYGVTSTQHYLELSEQLSEKALNDFEDKEHGGFFLSGNNNETLIIRPKETYDGAIPSGNSVMAYNFVLLSQLTENSNWEQEAKRQLEFMSSSAESYPMGNSFFLLALSNYLTPPYHVTVVLKEGDSASSVLKLLPLNTIVTIKKKPTDEYSLLNDKTTYYVCNERNCLPPSNNLDILKKASQD